MRPELQSRKVVFRSPRLGMVCVIACVVSFSARAQFGGASSGTNRKQEEKKTARWTLADWLAQKQRMRMMDLWLAQNSHSSPFELFLEGHSFNYGKTNGSLDQRAVNNNTYGGELAAYAGVAGLRGSYDSDSEQRATWQGSVNLRLFGRALQDTHINLEYGLRGMALHAAQPDEYVQHQYGRVSVNFYLTKFFGIGGSYARILPAESDQDRQIQGENEKAGVFIDFGSVRIFGDWMHEYLRFRDEGAPDTREIRDGFGGGLRIFF
ncbi:MAG: hypothetical protein AB7G93_19435 [Bdellovibrionales bacterium]